MVERADEVEYLRFFVQRADVHSSVVENLQQAFVEKTGKRPPEGWDHCPYCGYLNQECVCP